MAASETRGFAARFRSAARWVRETIRGRTLSLRRLPRTVQALAVLSLVTAAVTSLAILDVGDFALHVKAETRQPNWREWPLRLVDPDIFVSSDGPQVQFWIVTVLVYVGLAVGGATVAYAALSPSWRFPRATLLFIACTGLVCAALLKTIGDRLSGFPPERTTGSLEDALTRYRIAGIAGFALCAVVALVPLRLGRRVPLAIAAAAAAPFLLALALWATSGRAGILTQSAPDGVQRLRGLGAGVAFQTGQAAVMVLALLLLWGVVEAVRASRDAAVVAGSLFTLPEWALGALVAAKLAWVAVGLGGGLPSALGGASAIWAHARGDGAGSWLLAALLGLGFALLLARPPSLEERVTPVAGLVVIGMLIAGPAIEFVTDTADASLRAWWDRDRYPGLGWFIAWWGDYKIVLSIALLALAAPAGLGLLRRSRTLGLFLVLVGVWSMPRAIGAAIDLERGVRGSVGDNNLIEGSNRFAWVDLVTLDLVVSVVVATLAIAWWTGRQRRVPPRTLVLVLAASTVATYTAQLVPDDFRVGLFFYLGIVFPVAYLFVFDSDSLNEAGESRPVRVLATTGLAAVSVAAALNAVSAAFLTPERNSATTLGLSVYKGPFLLLVLLASLPLLRGNLPGTSTARGA